MPRHADEKLEGRILDAAQILWVNGGDQALTMRAVAKAAGTTTPSLYQRFPSKGDIRQALRRRAQRTMRDVLANCKSPMQVCEDYLKFALLAGASRRSQTQPRAAEAEIFAMDGRDGSRTNAASDGCSGTIARNRRSPDWSGNSGELIQEPVASVHHGLRCAD
jgi:AcrR family transcriptional regulator